MIDHVTNGVVLVSILSRRGIIRRQEILWDPAGRKGGGAFRARALPGAYSVGRTPHPPSRDGELFPPVLRRLGEAYARSRPHLPSASETFPRDFPALACGSVCKAKFEG